MNTKFEFNCKHLNLAYTLECGQCFRWKKLEDGYYYGVTGNLFVRIRQQGTRFEGEVAASDEVSVFGAFSQLEHYFGVDEDAAYVQNIDRIRTDEHIAKAIDTYYGLRLLRQPPFEVLISFILAAANNMPAVGRTLQAISKRYGTMLVLDKYRNYLFPAAATLLTASENELNTELGAEYRAKYILGSTRAIVEKNFDFELLRDLPYDWAHGQLTVLPGVGKSVADWTLLFGLGKREAFPLDTWVTRAMETFYFKGEKVPQRDILLLATAKWGEQAGYANEFLYMYARNHLR